MAIPDNFSYTENLQNGIKKILNNDVNEWFRDVDDIHSNTSRAELKRLCIHQELDSYGDTQLRIQLFQYIKGTTLERMILTNSVPDKKYDMESLQQIPASNHPKIIIFFAQHGDSLPPKEVPVTAEVSFRMISKVNYVEEGVIGDVIDKNELRSIAERIRSNLGSFKFVKGSQLFTCKNPIHGFFGSKIYASNKSEAVQLFEKLHLIAGATFKKEYIDSHSNLEKTSRTKPTKKITGYDNKKRTEHKWRPVATVYFRYAIADCGLNTKIPLYDKTGIFHDALIR